MTSSEIGRLALEAMLLEVSATPKPGLVDRNNSGAHKDMDFFTFMKSAASLSESFVDFAEEGFAGGASNLPPAEIFPSVRQIGIEAERRMFAATSGVNTHKGEIFSLGLLSACAGYLAGRWTPPSACGSHLPLPGEARFSSPLLRGDVSRSETGGSFLQKGLTADEVMRLAGEMCSGICERDFAGVNKKSTLTKGERVFLELGITGIRGEAEAGYPSVRASSLPALRKYLSGGLSLNDAMSMTLIHIMANAQDTNIISRHSIETAQEVVKTAKKMIETGFGLEDIMRLDDEFITRWISPGGSGDLLAVTYFLFALGNSFSGR